MITLWHNPRCSKSRAALALLQEAGVEVTVRRYLEDTPKAEEIATVLAALGGPPAIEMMRRGEKQFKEAGLQKDMGDALLIEAMATHPILIERPIAILRDRAVIGRPPENVLTLLTP